jgi:acetylornithine deacetylase/succinyl-diaminopimelate desuccinylase-like protein
MKSEKIENALQILKPISYQSFDVGYFVLLNGSDMGNSDYCENCIDKAVKEARKFHKEQRQKVLDKFKQISENGFLKVGRKKINIKAKYTEKEIAKAKRYELREYPAKASFTYEGHDPDFGGGLKEPCTCEGCGEAFTCNFEPNKEEAEYLFEIVKNKAELTERNKWEIDIALYNYEYADDDAKPILDKIVEKLLS